MTVAIDRSTVEAGSSDEWSRYRSCEASLEALRGDVHLSVHTGNNRLFPVAVEVGAHAVIPDARR